MKSVEVMFAEAMDALKKVGHTKQYEEASKAFTKETTIEVKLNCVESILKDAGIVRVKESGIPCVESAVARLSHEQYQVFAKRLGKNPQMSFEDQRKLAESILQGEIKEATTRKHNGAVENFVEGSPFNGDRGNNFSPGYTKHNTAKDVAAKSDKVMFDHMLKRGEITEAQHRKLTGQKPLGYEKLSEQQRRDFDFACAIGISEADAFKLADITTIKEVTPTNAQALAEANTKRILGLK